MLNLSWEKNNYELDTTLVDNLKTYCALSKPEKLVKKQQRKKVRRKTTGKKLKSKMKMG